jgi:hypothetical protein
MTSSEFGVHHRVVKRSPATGDLNLGKRALTKPQTNPLIRAGQYEPLRSEQTEALDEMTVLVNHDVL